MLNNEKIISEELFLFKWMKEEKELLRKPYLFLLQGFIFFLTEVSEKISSGSMQCNVICLWNPCNDLCCGRSWLADSI